MKHFDFENKDVVESLRSVFCQYFICSMHRLRRIKQSVGFALISAMVSVRNYKTMLQLARSRDYWYQPKVYRVTLSEILDYYEARLRRN